VPQRPSNEPQTDHTGCEVVAQCIGLQLGCRSLGVMERSRVDRLVSLLRDRGLRLTLARRCLIEELVASGAHLTAEQLSDRIQASVGEIHRATIYRSLEALEGVGVVEHVHLGHGPAVYHLADDIHQHLVCESCGAVIEAPPGLLASAQRRLAPTGFRLRAHHFALIGRCANCGPATSSA